LWELKGIRRQLRLEAKEAGKEFEIASLSGGGGVAATQRAAGLGALAAHSGFRLRNGMEWI